MEYFVIKIDLFYGEIWFYRIKVTFFFFFAVPDYIGT